MKLEKIITGGQTGVDIGALVGARKAGYRTGGNATKGFLTENGEQSDILKSYGLTEHPSPKYMFRTKANIDTACVTIILATDTQSKGTALAQTYCDSINKPYLTLNPFHDCHNEIIAFIKEHDPIIVNVAGNRESISRGIALQSSRAIFGVLTAVSAM